MNGEEGGKLVRLACENESLRQRGVELEPEACVDITEGKERRNALQVATERFQRLVDANIVGIVIADATGKIIEANDYYLTLVDFTREEFQQGLLDWRALTPPEWLDTDERAIRELHDRGTCTPYEKEYVRRDGTRVPVFHADALLPGPGAEVVAFALDLTARKRIEAALAASERRFRFLNELGTAARAIAAPYEVMTVLTRLLGTYLGTSRCAYADVDSDSESFRIQQDFTDGCSTSIGDYKLSFFGAQVKAKLLAGQTLVLRDLDAELSRSEGATTFSSIGIKAIICCPLSKGGSLRAMLAVHQTTPRRWTADEISLVEEVAERSWAYIEYARAEASLRETAEKFQYVFENSALAKSLTSPTGELRVNQAFCDLLGYTADELANRRWQEISYPDDMIASQEAVAGMLSGQFASTRFIKRYLHKNGETIWADVSTSLRRDAAGNPLYFVTSVLDITERKRAELKLAEQLNELRRWQDAMLDREDRVQELKNEVNDLCTRLGAEIRYPSQSESRIYPAKRQ